MKILIAGLGSIGRRHLRNVAASGEHEISLYRTHQSTMPEADLAGYPVYTDLTQALDQQPDAVVVSNPTALHLDVAIPAAERGIHLLLEKPVSHSMERVDELQRLVAARNVRVLVGFQYRFHPTLGKVKEWLSAGEIGEPASFRVVWGDYLPGWHPWEDYRVGYAARPELGGGVALTLCHPFDYLRWMFGEVQSVWGSAVNAPGLEIGSEGVVDAGLTFVGGLTGTVHLDYVQQPGIHELEIVGTRGMIRWQNNSGEASLYRAANAAWENVPTPPGFERNHLFIAEAAAFVDLVQGKAATPCSLADGRKALEIVLSVLESATTGRRINVE
jgi:predicted dehydrogenase